MILPSNDYILLGCGIMPGDDETLVAIKGEKGEYLHNYKDLAATNCQLLPNGYMMTNTQCTEMNRHVYFEDVKVMDQKRNVIVNFPIHRMSHECIFGSNAPRYYTPAFDYSTLNTNVLCIQGAMGTNKAINPKEDIVNNLVNEYDKDGNLVWSWNASDHFEQLGLTEEEIAEMHKNPMVISCFGDGHDWIHLNTACAVGANKWYEEGDERFNPENIICCSRNLSMVFIIEKTTGNIVYTLKGKDFDFDFQHYAHVIPKGLPGEGNILLLDSYTGKHEGKEGLVAKILEINPITNEVVFEYSGSFASDAMGSVQKLEDGCYLISACHSKKILVVDAKGELVSTFYTDKLFYRVNAYPANWIE